MGIKSIELDTNVVNGDCATPQSKFPLGKIKIVYSIEKKAPVKVKCKKLKIKIKGR